MRMFHLGFIVLVVASFSVFAQTLTDSEVLNQQIAEFYRQGKFGEAIPLSKKVVSNEKKTAQNSETHAIALMNLGMLYKERMRSSIRSNESAKPEDRGGLIELIGEDAKNAEEALRDSLDIYAKTGQGDSLSAALLKNELAWVSNNYFPFASPGGPRPRIDEAEKLYTEALATQEKLSGAEADVTLRSVLGLGDFYMRWINFEKAMPFYERYVASVEKKLGNKSKALVPALRALVELDVITERNKEAGETAKRISAITGRPEPVPVTSPRLALRGRKIERIKVARFAPPAGFDNPGFLLSYAYGAGQISMMGRVRVKQIAVNILVDEDGNVAEAKVADTNLKDVNEIEKAALASKFRPFNYKGEPRKMRGTLIYPYFEN